MTPDPSIHSPMDETRERTVLVVDDNPMDRRLAGRMIERGLGWRVAYASNGREALACLNSVRPDLILTDLFMPEVNGLELVEAAADGVFPSYPHRS